MSFGTIVYALCALTSGVCALLLARGYVRSRARLLFWSSGCFALLFVNNLLLFVDFTVLPGTSLLLARLLTALLAAAFLVWGLIWDGTT